MGKKERLQQLVKEREDVEQMEENCSEKEELECTKRLNETIKTLKKSGLTDKDLVNFNLECKCKK